MEWGWIFNYDTKAKNHKRKIHKFDYIKIFNKNFCFVFKTLKSNWHIPEKLL